MCCESGMCIDAQCVYSKSCTCMWDEGACIKEIVHGIVVCIHVCRIFLISLWITRSLYNSHYLALQYAHGHTVPSLHYNYRQHSIPPPPQERPAKPDMPWLIKTVWNTCCDMEDVLPAFKGLCKDLTSTPVYCKLGRWEACGGGGRCVGEVRGVCGRWEGCSSGGKGSQTETLGHDTLCTCIYLCIHCTFTSVLSVQVNVNPPNPGEYPKQDPPAPQPTQEGGESPPITGHWDERLSSFQKLIMVKAFREEKVGV